MPTKPFVTPAQFAAQPAQVAAAAKQKSNDAKAMARYDSAVKANKGFAPGAIRSQAQLNSNFQAAEKAGTLGKGFGGEPPAKKPAKTTTNTLRPQKAKPSKKTPSVMVPQGTAPSKAAKAKTSRY